MTLPPERAGSPLLVKERELPFSFFPMTRTNRRWGLHSMLYAAEPWAVITGAVRDAAGALTDVEAKSALSFVRQAKEYFNAAERAGALETRPLLYYYSFLNLGKAIAIARGRPNMVGKVTHGVASDSSFGYLPTTAQLQLQASGGRSPSAIAELHSALEGTAMVGRNVRVADLMPQSVVGHRMWRAATGTIRKERFFAIDEIRWLEDEAAHQIWLKLYLRRDTLQSFGRPVAETLRESGLRPTFRAVSDPDARARGLHALEQIAPTSYSSGRAADVVMDSVATVRGNIWQTVTATSPFRRFYLYLSPANEVRLPQWMTVYTLLFWLGSLTRYQPVELLDNLAGPYGPFFEEFIETQPAQLLYFLASEARQQDVSKPALV